ncbi:hypothetical protein FXW78_45390 [Rhodococcus opacus]|nr:hypothetical protein [Rhodococcus opacus]
MDRNSRTSHGRISPRRYWLVAEARSGWSCIAQDFVAEMGFADGAGRAAARWVAIQYGMSADGNGDSICRGDRTVPRHPRGQPGE